jgi:MFS family permease
VSNPPEQKVRPVRGGSRGAGVGRAQRAAVIAVFVSHGLLFASWTAHIPQVKAHLQLDDGALGIALLGAPLGSVAAMLVAARALPRFGSRPLVQVSLLGYCLAGPLTGVAGSLPALFAALFAWGVFQGALDVSMNTQAVTVERAAGRPLMSGFHGAWSIGAFAGAGAGAIGVAAGLALTPQLLLLAIPVLAIAGPLTLRMLRDPEPAGNVAPKRPVRFTRPVLLLGIIAFACMLCEGATADWAAVYLRGTIKADAAVAGLGYTAFLLTMVAVRLGGNRLLARFRPARLLPVLTAAAAAGFAGGLLSGSTAGVIAGCACLGAGLGLVIPTVFSAAGRISDLNAGTAIAMVAGFGWAGFVFGPPIIGELASATSLTTALWILPALTACIAVATARTRALRASPPA